MACKQHFRPREFGLSHGFPGDFLRLEFGRPLLYLPWSAAWALYHFVWVCLEGYWWSLKSHYVTLDWFRQLSNVGYTVLTAFALVDFFIAFYAYCLAPRLAHVEPEVMQWYHKFSWVLYNITITTALSVTVTYWAFLSGDGSMKGSTINKHGINFLYSVLIIIASRKPIKLQHVYMPVLFSFCYMIFTVIYFSATKNKVYPILDWSKPGKAIKWVVLYTFVCVPIVHLLLFGLYRLKLYLKDKLSKAKDKPNDAQSQRPGSDANQNEITGEASTAQLLPVSSDNDDQGLTNLNSV